MAGLKKIADQSKFRKKCEKVADETGYDVEFYPDARGDDAFEDDGCLHVCRHGLRAAFLIGQDTPGATANAATRTIMETVGMKRKIGERVLVEEECETCDGSGKTTHDCGHEHDCGDCDGKGFTTPEDYK